MDGSNIIGYNKRVFLDETRDKYENLKNENLINKKLKKEYHNIIDIYLRSLFFILSKNKECFIKGAYIINDTSGKLLDTLENLKITSNLFSRYIKNTTHNKYLQKGINLNEIILEKSIINNYCINCATGICNTCDIIEYNSIKYYPIIKSKDEKIKYIFLKLETSSTFTLSHALRKVNMLKKEAEAMQEAKDKDKTDQSKFSKFNSSFSSKKCPTYREDCDRYDECRSREAYLQKDKYELQCKDSANINEKYLKDLEEFEKKHHANITKSNSHNKLDDCNDDSICIKNKILETSNVFFVSEEINNFIFDNCIDKTNLIGGSFVKFNKKFKSRKKCCSSKKYCCSKKYCSTRKCHSYRKKIYNK